MSEKFIEQHKVETFKSLITISMEVFKYLILINGGAAAGVLASIDKIVRVIDVISIRNAMVCFVLGLVAATAATFIAYFTQKRLHAENIGMAGKRGHYWYVAAGVALCVASLALFSTGALIAAFSIH